METWAEVMIEALQDDPHNVVFRGRDCHGRNEIKEHLRVDDAARFPPWRIVQPGPASQTTDVPRLLAELEGLEALLVEINREISQRLAEGTEGEGGLGRRIVAAIRGGKTRRKR